jgi:hypothetical protein
MPERDVPGTRARACAQPITMPCHQTTDSRRSLPGGSPAVAGAARRSANHITTAQTAVVAAIRSGHRSSSSMTRPYPAPASVPGSVAIPRIRASRRERAPVTSARSSARK